MLSPAQTHAILECLARHGATAGDFIISLLRSGAHSDAKMSIYHHSQAILDCLSQSTTDDHVETWACSLVTRACAREIVKLTQQSTGLHFLAGKTSYQQVTEMDIEHLSDKMKMHAPTLWNLLGVLLQADEKVAYARKWMCAKRSKKSLAQSKSQTEDITIGNRIDEEDKRLWGLVGDFPSSALAEGEEPDIEAECCRLEF